MKLDGAGAGLGDRLCVDVRINIRLHDGQGHLVAQGLDRARERRGLARARARHQVEQERPLRAQAIAQLIGMGVVVRKHALLDLQHPHVLHTLPLFVRQARNSTRLAWRSFRWLLC